MPESAGIVSDERFALALLIDHLMSRGMPRHQCKINTNDPPDLIVTLERGERWGVEVTRLYQQVEQIGEPTVVSFEGVRAFLVDFADDIAKGTEGKREFNYTIYLEGPGPFSSWKAPISKREWKKETRKSILEHIASGNCSELRFPGGILEPPEPGNGWRVMIGGSAAQIDSAIEATLHCVLKDKTRGLRRWKEQFTQCWLLLLNIAEVDVLSANLCATMQN